MKNIINEKPSEEIWGLNWYSANFIKDRDVFDKEILDIGCGYGWQELNLLQRQARLIAAIEISESNLKTARDNVENEKVEFSVGDANNLSFKNEIFDTVLAWEVIEHVTKDHEENVFKEIYRVLKSGGRFYLSTPNNSFFCKVFDPAWWLMGHRHYDIKKLIEIGESVGFKVETAKINGGWWGILTILNLYISKWLLRRPLLFKEFFSKKQNSEYMKEKGFAGIFICFYK